MKYRPKLDPKVDLAGATPETLAKALMNAPYKPLSSHVRKAVVSDEVAVEEVAVDHPGDGVAHLRDGF